MSALWPLTIRSSPTVAPPIITLPPPVIDASRPALTAPVATLPLALIVTNRAERSPTAVSDPDRLIEFPPGTLIRPAPLRLDPLTEMSLPASSRVRGCVELAAVIPADAKPLIGAVAVRPLRLIVAEAPRLGGDAGGSPPEMSR